MAPTCVHFEFFQEAKILPGSKLFPKMFNVAWRGWIGISWGERSKRSGESFTKITILNGRRRGQRFKSSTVNQLFARIFP